MGSYGSDEHAEKIQPNRERGINMSAEYRNGDLVLP